jgi:acyl carrier protein
MNAEQELLIYVQSQVKGSAPIQETTELVVSGLLDSLAIINLVEFIEKKWGVTLGQAAGKSDLIEQVEQLESAEMLDEEGFEQAIREQLGALSEQHKKPIKDGARVAAYQAQAEAAVVKLLVCDDAGQRRRSPRKWRCVGCTMGAITRR